MINGTNTATPSGAAPTAQAASQQAPKGANGNAPATIGQKVMRGATVAVAIAIGATGGTFSAIGFLEYTQLTQVTEAAPMPTLSTSPGPHDLTQGYERLDRLGEGKCVALRFRNAEINQDVTLFGYEFPYHVTGQR